MAGRIYPQVDQPPAVEVMVEANQSAPPGGDDTQAPVQIAEYQNPSPLPEDSKLGETKRQMELAHSLYEQRRDTSIDEPWIVNGFGVVDVYTLLVMLVFLVPKMLIFYPLLWILLFPPVFFNWIYVKSAAQPLASLSRTSCVWTMHCVFQWGMSLPATLFVAFNYLFDNMIWLFFGILYCTLTCGWSRYSRNLAVIRPFTGGPSLYTHFPDLVACTAGMLFRQGLLEFMRAFPMMFILNPWIKYWMIGNPFLFDFTEKLRFITQIGQKMNDMPVEGIDSNFKKCISNCKHIDKNRAAIDEKFFCPHYPYPPPGRQYAVGMQMAMLITTFVHTTHIRGDLKHAFVLSSSSQVPEYRVMLWHNNPFHIFTGYVEANITHGRPSQEHKQYGAEHPMWLVSGHNYLGACRKVKFSIGWIDVFFDRFIPHFQHFIRGNVRGWAVADEEMKRDPAMGYEDQQAARGEGQQAAQGEGQQAARVEVSAVPCQGEQR